MRPSKRAWRRFAELLIAALILAGTNSTTAVFAYTSSASTTPTFVTKFGVAGPGNGHLSGPTFDTVGPNGNVYVDDLGNHRIEEFSPTGTYITKWGSAGSGNGQFQNAAGLATDANGNVYVADFYNNRVQEFTSAGAYITQWGTAGNGNGQFASPAGVAINHTTGNIYVTDSANSRVQEFSSNGTYLAQWNGGVGHTLTTPFGIDINQKTQNIYITDDVTHKISEYSSDGTFITQWGGTGNGNGQFQANYMNIAISQASGDVYAGDSGNDRVQAFTADGTYLYQWGTFGIGNGDFSDNTGIAFDQYNNVFTVEFSTDRVQEFAIPQELATETIPGGSAVVNLTLPVGSNITSESIASDTTSNKHYFYPFGLFTYTFIAANNVAGATVPVQVTFQTTKKPSEVTPQKYDATTHTYTAIPGATVTATTVNGQPALLLSYSITDGGSLDKDGVANGIIVDPITLRVTKPISMPSAPDTGYGKPNNDTQVIATLLIAAGILLGLIGVRTSKASQPRPKELKIL